jgi:hypothetical protein
LNVLSGHSEHCEPFTNEPIGQLILQSATLEEPTTTPSVSVGHDVHAEAFTIGL